MKWTRQTEAGPASRTINADERGNVTLTVAEVEGLLKLAGYEEQP